jgi:MFS transporter, PPP family, 3-phenylpropionic acid transporter
MFRISLFIFLLFSTYSAVGLFLPVYFQSIGLSSSQIGLVIACGSLISIFAQPFWGFVSDKKKAVKPVLLILLISALCISAGLFSVRLLLLIVVFYAAFMFFNSASAPLTESLCISYSYENNKPYGRIRLWGEIGVGLSALSLGLLVERLGLAYLWHMYAFLMILAIASSFLLKDTQSTPVPVNLSALRKLFSQPKLLWFLFLVLLVATTHKINDSMFALYLVRQGATQTQLGLSWLVATLSTIPTLLIVDRLIKRWSELAVFVFASVAYSLRWAIYVLADSPSMLVAAQMLHSITFPLLLVSSIRYLNRIVPPELRSSGQAAFAVTFGGIGGIIGSSTGGYIFQNLGPGATYGTGSALALVGAIATVLTIAATRRRNRSTSQPSPQAQQTNVQG